MATPSSNNSSIILELKRDSLSTDSPQKEIFVTTEHISSWNLQSIHTSQIVRVQAERNKLIQESTYFRSLLTGSFSESSLDSVSVEWNPETVIDVLKFIYGFPIQFSVDNFVPLMEGALFFGVESVLSNCMAWFSNAMSVCNTELLTLNIPLESLVEIWSFGLEHSIGCIPEQCTGYLARNFMWAVSCSSFVEVPYDLLSSCLKHSDLTTDSEMHLAEALLSWLDFNTRLTRSSPVLIKVDYTDILNTVRVKLLPLGFAAGKKRSCYFSEHAEKSISAILSLVNNPSTSLLHVLRDGFLHSIQIRLTQYTERIDVSGCPQITSALLLLSLLPCTETMDASSEKRIKDSVIEIVSLNTSGHAIPKNLFQTLRFEAVYEMDVSKCPRLNIEAAIHYSSKSFPSLKTFKASYCLHYKLKTLFHLVENCPLVNEVYLIADTSPAIPTQVSTISTSIEYRDLDAASYKVVKERPLLSNITKLILKGRTELNDLDLINISLFSGSLCYLDLKGCTSVTDNGISKFISQTRNLTSLVVSDTYFGNTSMLALCSGFQPLESNLRVQNDHSTSLASRLQKLHISGCKSVDVTYLVRLLPHTFMLKSLSMRGTSVDDDAINCFLGSSLERLNVSETMVSGVALARIIKRNPGLKLIKSRGCRNLSHLEDNIEGSALSYGFTKGENLYVEIGATCKLENVEFGWGLCSSSLDDLGPAIRSLRHLTLGLGASLSEDVLMLLPSRCPLLESVVLKFQVISNSIVKSLVGSLKQLQALGLCYCLGDLSPLSFRSSMPNLRKLQLERVIPWLTNDDLIILTQNCPRLIELSLSGCTQLNSDSQQIISCGWPGLSTMHLEDCGEVTSNGVSSLFDCQAIEDLLLRHNGCGIQRNFIVDAAAKMPMLRKIALDLCDACGGGFESPSYADRGFLSSVTIARCKLQKCAFELQNSDAWRRPVHKETIVLEWNSKGLRTTIVEERVG